MLRTVTPIFFRSTLQATIFIVEVRDTPSSVGQSIMIADVRRARLRNNAICPSIRDRFADAYGEEPVKAGFFDLTLHGVARDGRKTGLLLLFLLRLLLLRLLQLMPHRLLLLRLLAVSQPLLFRLLLLLLLFFCCCFCYCCCCFYSYSFGCFRFDCYCFCCCRCDCCC